MKPPFPWHYRRILAEDSLPPLEAASPFTAAVAQCQAERRRGIQVLASGSATLALIFALGFLMLGRLSVETVGPETVIPVNPESASALQARYDALAAENTHLVDALQEAQTAVEDLEDLAARHDQDFPAPAARPAPSPSTLPADGSLTSMTASPFPPRP